MKKLTFWKSLFLLCALIVGSSSAWATDVTYKHVFTKTELTNMLTSAQSLADETNNELTFSWSLTATKTSGTAAIGSNDSNGRGIQIGSGSAANACRTLTLSTSDITGTIKQIKVVGGLASSGSGKINVEVNGNAYDTEKDLLGSGSAAGTYTFDGSAIGDILITMTQPTTSKAMYLKSVEVTYEVTPTGPTISVDPTSLSDFTYVAGNGPSNAQTISVSGANLTANLSLSLGDNSNYEICQTENGTYTNSLTLTQSEGAVAATDVYVRLKSGLEKGTRNGTLTLSSTDATSVEVSLSGSVTGQLYAVTIATGLTGGEIEADPTSAAEGAEITLSAEPSSGYRLSAWDVYKTADATTKVTVTNNKFTMPDYAVTVSATFELIPTVNYTLTTSVVPGRHYIIVGKKDDVYKAMGEQKDNNRAAVEISVNDNKTSIASDAGVYEVLLGVDESGYFTFYDVENNGYLYAACGTGTGNYMRVESNLDDDGYGLWTINIANTGVATVKATSGGRNWMRYNYNSGNSIISCYGSGQQDIYLFERDGDTGTQDFTASINSACTDGTKYYGTFSAPFAFTVPAGVTVSEIGINEGKLDVEEYAANAIIPANTGVMISSTTAGNKTFTSAKGGTSVKGDNNRLRPTYWGLTAKEMGDADDDCLFYRLTMHGYVANENPGVIGFYWGAASGAEFAIAGNKAYLAVPTAQATAREGFAFGDTTTGINGVEEIAPVTKTRKVVKNGRLVIETANGEFTIDGARMK